MKPKQSHLTPYGALLKGTHARRRSNKSRFLVNLEQWSVPMTTPKVFTVFERAIRELDKGA